MMSEQAWKKQRQYPTPASSQGIMPMWLDRQMENDQPSRAIAIPGRQGVDPSFCRPSKHFVDQIPPTCMAPTKQASSFPIIIINTGRDSSPSALQSSAEGGSKAPIAFGRLGSFPNTQCRVYEPAEFIQRISDANSSSVQEERSGLDIGIPHAWLPQISQPTTSYGFTSMPDPTYLSTPALTPSNSVASCAESFERVAMSANVSCSSSFDGSPLPTSLDMDRFDSKVSTSSDCLFPIDEIGFSTDSMILCPTVSPGHRGQQSDVLYREGCKTSPLLGATDYGGIDAISFSSNSSKHDMSDMTDLIPQPYNSEVAASLLKRMEKSPSSQSTQSSENPSSAEMKATRRMQKHIWNSRQNIAPKECPVEGTFAQHCNARAPAIEVTQWCDPEPANLAPKEAISKQPYRRTKHEKLFCSECDGYPGGFRGEHELRRHQDRAHSERRKVWICTTPMQQTKYSPAKPLDDCRHCCLKKQYNVYYNAAAHLRRAHFNPRKRGRKARGETRESRAGKTGGDWPPINWMKANGWLTEIEVLGPPLEHSTCYSDTVTVPDDNPEAFRLNPGADMSAWDVDSVWPMEIEIPLPMLDDLQEDKLTCENLFPGATDHDLSSRDKSPVF